MPLVPWVMVLFLVDIGVTVGDRIAQWCHLNIAFLELYPIVLSLHLWGHEMQNQRIHFCTDNEALVHVINKQSCRDKNLMF